MSLGADGPPGAAPIDPLRVRSDAGGPCLIVEAEGELTILTAARLRDHVLAGMRELDGPPRVVLDVGGVGSATPRG